MKKVIAAAVIALALVAGGCSSKKTATKLDDGAQLIEKTRSEQMAEEKPEIRALGQATANNAGDARIYAENDARGEFVRKFQSVITTGIRRSQNDAEMSKANNEETRYMNDAAAERNLMNQTMANMNLPGVVIVNSDTYKQKNGQYRCYVCVEYRGGVANLANEMTRSYQRAMNNEYGDNNISDEERAKIAVRSEEFRQSILEELERMGLR